MTKRLGLPTDEDSFTMFDLYQPEEAMLTASTLCLLPVVTVNGLPLEPERRENLPGSS